MKKIVYNVVGSIMKVIASSNVDVSKDLEKNDKEQKTIAELLNEQKKQTSEQQQ